MLNTNNENSLVFDKVFVGDLGLVWVCHMTARAFSMAFSKNVVVH